MTYDTAVANWMNDFNQALQDNDANEAYRIHDEVVNAGYAELAQAMSHDLWKKDMERELDWFIIPDIQYRKTGRAVPDDSEYPNELPEYAY